MPGVRKIMKLESELRKICPYPEAVPTPGEMNRDELDQRILLEMSASREQVFGELCRAFRWKSTRREIQHAGVTATLDLEMEFSGGTMLISVVTDSGLWASTDICNHRDLYGHMASRILYESLRLQVIEEMMRESKILTGPAFRKIVYLPPYSIQAGWYHAFDVNFCLRAVLRRDTV